MHTQHILLIVLALASPLVLAQQSCYTASGRSSGLTECQAPPFYTLAGIYTATGDCSVSSCTTNSSNNGVAGDSFILYTTDFNAIPKPLKYVQLMSYSDVQCLNPTKVERFTDSPCGRETSFYATCNQTHARVIQYSSGSCSDPISDKTYPINQCAGGPDEFIVASCGTSGSTPDTSPVAAPSTAPTAVPWTYTPRYYAPVTRRSTPLKCYYSTSVNTSMLYDETDASRICTRYGVKCPANVTYCPEGSTYTVYATVSRETCKQLQQYPQYYMNVICCETDYCNGPNGTPKTSISNRMYGAPSMALAATIAFVMYFVTFIRQ
eukprot:TRINITY_DN343_c1_g1_i1.p1 TRINITY_DN343_c1_g1~~TRINITY_DN343_c1_g1_i1.p1  ORF type:complete len:322 (-),score=-6.84 TRINITY_DN343_c1_g1_i1:38-1003(-)